MNFKLKERNTTWVHISILVIAVLVVYGKVFGAGFMSWDDIDYIFNTPDIRNFNGTSFKNWWTEYYIGNYQPLPVLTYALDFLMGGEEPFIYHLTNILWHIATTLMLYFTMRRLHSDVYIALFVTLLFALHPVQTESVSWVAARNKVMNGFFFLAAIYIYLGYLKDQSSKKLALVCLLGLAAYLCKLTAVTLPFALVGVDIWMNRPLKSKTVWIEKLPLIALAIPIGLITLQAQEQVDFLNLHPEFNFLHTIVFAGYAYVQYLVNLFVPYKLSVLYPYPTEIGIVHVLYTIIAVAIVVWGGVAYRKKQFVLAGGILFYTVNIAIVLQFVQFGEVLMADRYLYLACIGVWYPVVYYLHQLFTQKQGNRQLSIAVLTVICLLYSISTFSRNNIWLNELNFWQSVVDKFPNSSVAQSSLGGVYIRDGKMEEAEPYIDEAVKIDKSNYKAWHNKAVLLLRKGDTKGALEALDKALAVQEYHKALFTRALVYQQIGKCDLAMIDVEKVLDKEPDNARAHYIKADCTEQRDALNLALESYNLAIQYDYQEPLFYLRRGLVLAKTGDPTAALKDLDQALVLKPQYAEALYWRAMVKYRNKQNPCADLQAAYQNAVQQKQMQLANVSQKALSEICTPKSN